MVLAGVSSGVNRASRRHIYMCRQTAHGLARDSNSILAWSCPMSAVARGLTSYRKYWAARFGVAPFLPMSRAEMEKLGWDSCDVIIVTGDAYVDHPSFGMAIMGRLLEAQGFRVGIIA